MLLFQSSYQLGYTLQEYTHTHIYIQDLIQNLVLGWAKTGIFYLKVGHSPLTNHKFIDGNSKVWRYLDKVGC